MLLRGEGWGGKKTRRLLASLLPPSPTDRTQTFFFHTHTHTSERTDAFSFGVCLYEMVARSLPWKGLTHAIVAHRVLAGRRLPVPPNADPALAEIMRRCWRQEPAQRPNFEFIYRRLKVWVACVVRGVEGKDEWGRPCMHGRPLRNGCACVEGKGRGRGGAVTDEPLSLRDADSWEKEGGGEEEEEALHSLVALSAIDFCLA